jgi:Septum formation initiator.
MKLPAFINKRNIIRLLINRYFLIGVGFILLLVLSENSIVYTYKLHKQLNELNSRREFYLNEIKQDSINIIKLRTDMDAIEKFGREKYMMKKDNEDIFIVR